MASDTSESMAAPANAVVWCLTDRRTGHRRQIEGLVKQLERRRAASIHWIDIENDTHLSRLTDWIRRKFDEGAGLPNPSLIIAAGHRTHLPALAAQRAWGGRTVILMRPSLPVPMFDLCLIPEHDQFSLIGRLTRFNAITTRGVLNPFTAETVGDESQALIMIGGPSRHHGWSDRQMIEQIVELIRLAPSTVHWTLTTSRRTPGSFLQSVEEITARNSMARNLKIVPFDRTGPGWLCGRLAASGSVFVTEDSVSMIYESLTTGANVGVLAVPRLRRSRNSRCVDQLIDNRFVVHFDGWRRDRFDRCQKVPFNEAARCADIVCERLLDAA